MHCISCGGKRIWKDGLRHNGGKAIQRFLCRSCGYRFSKSKVKVNITGQVLERPKTDNDLAHNVISKLNFPLKESVDDLSFLSSKDVTSHNCTVIGQGLNILCDCSSTRRICAPETKVAKFLVKVEPRTETALRESTPEQAKINGLIVQFLWYLTKENYAKLTIKRYVNDIKLLVKRGANILDCESVKMTIAKQNWNDNRKIKVYYVYNAFVRMLGKTWDMPRLRIEQKLGFCPTERTVQQAIAGFGKKVSIMIQLIAETGIRAGEANNLEWNQINFKTATITVIPEKGSNPTVKKVSRELLGRIQTLPKKSKKIFGELNANTMITNLIQQRKGLARKLGNQELLRLTFVSVRHFYGTKLYHRGKTLLEIMRDMGHKRFTSTLQYINYDKIIFGDEDEWICKVAETEEDRKNLIEASFQFVEQVENQSYYRKCKTGV